MAEKNYPIKVFYSIFFTPPRWAGGSGVSADSGSGVLASFGGFFQKNQPYPQLFSEHLAGCLVFLRIFVYNVLC